MDSMQEQKKATESDEGAKNGKEEEEEEKDEEDGEGAEKASFGENNEEVCNTERFAFLFVEVMLKSHFCSFFFFIYGLTEMG